MIEVTTGVVKIARELIQELGRQPLLEDIASRLNMPFPKLKAVLNISKESVSLDTPIGAAEDSNLDDLIEDKETLSPLEIVIRNDLYKQVERVLFTLDPKEAKNPENAVWNRRERNQHSGGDRTGV